MTRRMEKKHGEEYINTIMLELNINNYTQEKPSIFRIDNKKLNVDVMNKISKKFK